MNSDPILQAVLKPIWNKYCAMYSELALMPEPIIRFDGRIKVLARCYVETNVIRVSRNWYNLNKELYQTDIIPHEVAHQIDFNLNGEPEDYHGPSWQCIMMDYGIGALEYYEVNRENR